MAPSLTASLGAPARWSPRAGRGTCEASLLPALMPVGPVSSWGCGPAASQHPCFWARKASVQVGESSHILQRWLTLLTGCKLERESDGISFEASWSLLSKRRELDCLMNSAPLLIPNIWGQGEIKIRSLAVWEKVSSRAPNHSFILKWARVSTVHNKWEGRSKMVSL